MILEEISITVVKFERSRFFMTFWQIKKFTILVQIFFEESF